MKLAILIPVRGNLLIHFIVRNPVANISSLQRKNEELLTEREEVRRNKTPVSHTYCTGLKYVSVVVYYTTAATAGTTSKSFKGWIFPVPCTVWKMIL